MSKKLETKQKKRKWIACLLVLLMVFFTVIPASAMNESQQTGEKQVTEQAEKGAEDNNDPEKQQKTQEEELQPETTEQKEEDTSSEGEFRDEVKRSTEDKEEQDTAAEPETSSEASTSDKITPDKSASDKSASDKSALDKNSEQDAESIKKEKTNITDAQKAESDEESDKVSMQASSGASDALITAPDLVGTQNKANEWQIVSEKYVGREQSNKKGYDIDKDGSNDIYYQKNVIPTGVENEFRVYMGITKKMTWDEVLAESDFAITTANNWHKVAIGTQTPSINGNYSTVYPGKVTSGGNNYEAVVNYIRGGKVVHTYHGWYHGTTPNCSNGTGFIWMKSLKTYLVASHTVSLGNNGNQLTFTIDLDEMTKQNIHFSLDDIVVDSVQDTMGSFITYEGIENCDGADSYAEDTATLKWIPASNGTSGIEVIENGGLSGYHYNIHQLVYKVHLKVEQQGFHSCAQNMNSKVGDSESYKVNEQAVLNCHAGSYKGSTNFQVPYVRGLLYDLEFQKVIKGSKIALSDIKFTVSRETSGDTIAQKLAYEQEQKTDQDGWIKFHNLPWGIYTLRELPGEEDSFQKEYLDTAEQTKEYSIKIGKVINESALNQDHNTGHSVDQPSDIKNMLVKYNGTDIFENTPNTARITVKKVVSEYDKIPSNLKSQKYTVKAGSTGEKDIYVKPVEADTTPGKFEKQEKELGHEETVTYEIMVPKKGGRINLEEVIPEEVKDKIVFESATVEKNSNSTEEGEVTKKEQGCELTVLPGNDLTITIVNIPVGTVKIKKIIDNYQTKLAEDAFIIKAESAEDNGTSVNAEVVLKHQETSAAITIKKTTKLKVEEILPKEYSMSELTISGGGSLQGEQVTANPGEDIVITVHNTFESTPYFHVADAVKNIFKIKK